MMMDKESLSILNFIQSAYNPPLVDYETKLKAITFGNTMGLHEVQAEPFPELEAILSKCLAHVQRYQSIASLLDDLVLLA